MKYKKLNKYFLNFYNKGLKRKDKCDSVRIVNPSGKKMFLIICYNRNTKTDSKDRQWYMNGKKYDFDYVEEYAIASGRNKKSLKESIKEYKYLIENNVDCFKNSKSFKIIAKSIKKTINFLR